MADDEIGGKYAYLFWFTVPRDQSIYNVNYAIARILSRSDYLLAIRYDTACIVRRLTSTSQSFLITLICRKSQIDLCVNLFHVSGIEYTTVCLRNGPAFSYRLPSPPSLTFISLDTSGKVSGKSKSGKTGSWGLHWEVSITSDTP